ncbi:MBL fold metallo-hydrolase [Massilia sp. CCM 8695]|uniref:MBL fold metallo-hydrolase n=1 Tax=Massilia frigida TaxID=2609281 RepID=A0ABX0NIL7_9BURK|nr:MBL fold metallo-hydrolase [Massilia frigida]NHZ82673.1 MBL fold metallo-hydrolase [Massilia frigida]
MSLISSPTLLRCAAAGALATALAACAGTGGSAGTQSAGAVQFQQIRNATIKLEYAGTTFLVDPMLARKGAFPGFRGTYNSHLRNPLVELPLPLSEVVKADAIVVTHTHDDHWDDAAKQSLRKDMPIFTQNEEDAQSIRKDGFTDVRVLDGDTVFKGTRLRKTAGVHGTDQMMMVSPLAKRMGAVSGVVFERAGYKSVYVAGDTVWNGDVESAIKQFRPDVIILNTGYARVLGFEGSIIMGKEDLYRAYQLAPKATVVGIHMEALNHLMQTRKDLRDHIVEKNMDPTRVLVPEDGESYRF